MKFQIIYIDALYFKKIYKNVFLHNEEMIKETRAYWLQNMVIPTENRHEHPQVDGNILGLGSKKPVPKTVRYPN